MMNIIITEILHKQTFQIFDLAWSLTSSQSKKLHISYYESFMDVEEVSYIETFQIFDLAWSLTSS